MALPFYLYGNIHNTHSTYGNTRKHISDTVPCHCTEFYICSYWNSFICYLFAIQVHWEKQVGFFRQKKKSCFVFFYCQTV